MMRSKNIKRGMSLVELMAVVTIVIITSSVGAAYFGPTIRRNELTNQLKYVRAAFLKAKANAIEYSAPILFTIDPLEGDILILRDHDRDGDFTDDPKIVMGLSTTVGMGNPYKRHVRPDSRRGDASLPIWFQAGEFADRTADPFTDNGFIVMPTGRVHDIDTLDSAGGTFFFYSRVKVPNPEPTDAGDLDSTGARFYGAVHITAMGEVKIAFLKDDERNTGDFNGWKWLD